jgi:hypothetical protein
MANPNYKKGGAILSRVCELLLLIHRRLFAARKTPFQTHKEGVEVKLGRGRAVGV